MLGLNRMQILYSAVRALYTAGPPAVYDAVEKPLQIWQTAAVFEVFFLSSSTHCTSVNCCWIHSLERPAVPDKL